MALNPLMLGRLTSVLKEGQAIAAMGYPDIIYPPEKLNALLHGREVKYRDDSERICKRHGVPPHDVPDSESFFEAFGASLDVYDIVQERGDEIICDLNYPIPAQACGQYDYVLDVGTLEHCFNIAQALVNMACLLKVDGLIFHENPYNWGNHGFYNLNPTLFHDFYTGNGFVIEECALLPVKGAEHAVKAPQTKRFIFTEREANLFTVARRVEEKPMTFPTQTKYRNMGVLQ